MRPLMPLCLLTSLAGCRVIAQAGPVLVSDGLESAQAGPDARNRFQLGYSWVDRYRTEGDPVEDSLDGWSFWYARDLVGGAVRPALELGVGYSGHGVQGERRQILDVYRGCAGGRVTLHPSGWPISAWGHVGWFYRFSVDGEYDSEPYDQDGGGYYVGAGLDYVAQDTIHIGLFLDRYQGESGDELEERFYGIGIGWRF
jgi:hypothetical protein